jgi:hypothetical protein
MKPTDPSGLRKARLTLRKVVLTASAVVLLLAPAAAAHVTASPASVPARTHAAVTLEVPNERDVAMNELTVIVPDSMTVHDARPHGRWRATVTNQTVRWRGGSLAPRETVQLVLDVGTPRRAGRTSLTALQSFVDGGQTGWDVELFVTPATGGAGQHPLAAVGVGLVGVLGVVLASLFVLRRTRRRTLQEG